MKYPVEYEIAYCKAFQHLEDLYSKLGTYRAVAETLKGNISHTYIHMVLKDGYRPRKGKLIKALGLPEVNLVPMVICPHCKEPQVGNKCGCQAKPYPRLAKPKRDDYRRRIRIDIAPDTDKRTVKAIRDLPIEVRTNILKGAAVFASIPDEIEMIDIGYGDSIPKTQYDEFQRKQKETIGSTVMEETIETMRMINGKELDKIERPDDNPPGGRHKGIYP
jgi:hypothetical protein